MGDMNFKSLKPYESGFFVPYNVKDIRALNMKNGVAIVVGINNERIRIFSSKGNGSGNGGPIALAK
jgi:hypothetical protein